MAVDLIIKPTDAGLPTALRKFSVGAGFTLEQGGLGGGQSFEYTLHTTSHYIALHNIVLEDGEISVGGETPVQTRDLRGAISYFPKGLDVKGWSSTATRGNSYAAVYFHPALLHAEIESRFNERELNPLVYTRDLRMQTSLTALRDEASSGSIDALYAETLCLALAIEVLRCKPVSPRGGLSAKQLAATLDFIASNISENISLNDLAVAASLSRFHFAHAFKRSFGKSPAEFVRMRRVENATGLLHETSEPIEVVARSVGFADTNQLRRAFVDIHGCTPTEFRRRLGHLTPP